MTGNEKIFKVPKNDGGGEQKKFNIAQNDGETKEYSVSSE